MARLTDPRVHALQGEPIPVQMCGFFTNTYLLGAFGWELAMDDCYRDPYGEAVVLHHRKLGLSMFGRLHGSKELRHERMDRMMRGPYRSGSTDETQRDAWYMASGDNRPHIEVQRVATERSHVVQLAPFSPSMAWRDTEPRFVEETAGNLYKLPLFAELYRAPAESQELIVEPADVQTLLDQILAAQGPMRREIRARDKRRDLDNGPPAARQVHAQIVSMHV